MNELVLGPAVPVSLDDGLAREFEERLAESATLQDRRRFRTWLVRIAWRTALLAERLRCLVSGTKRS